MKTVKIALLILIVIFLNGCSGGGTSSSGSGAVAGSQISQSVQADDTVSRSYRADNLTADDSAILITSSFQREKEPSFSYMMASSFNSQRAFAPRYFKEISFEEQNPETKDLDPSFVKYGEFINKSISVNKKYIKSPKTFNEGDQENFNILLNGATYDICTAKCYKVGIHCYIFIDTTSENIPENDRAALAQTLARAFDTDNSPFGAGVGIYDKTRSYYGSEWSPGIDGDSKIFILISPKLGGSLYGYFYSLDETTADFSNQKEIIYVNDDIFAGNMYNGLTTISHEFSHLINYNMKFKQSGRFEETIISEGSAVMSEYLNGFTLNENSDYSGNGYVIRSIDTFLKNPYNFYFFYWSRYNYGAGFLFMLYIKERYGIDIFKSLQQSPKTGVSNIETYTGASFSDLFADWMLVNYYSGISGAPILPSGSSHVRYENFNPKGSYRGYTARSNSATALYSLGGITFSSAISGGANSGNMNIGQYSCRYFKITPDGFSGNLEFTYTSKIENAAYSIFIIEKPKGTFFSIQ